MNKIRLPIINSIRKIFYYHQLGLYETGAIIMGYVDRLTFIQEAYRVQQTAKDIIKTQPMTGPVGQIHTIKIKKCSK